MRRLPLGRPLSWRADSPLQRLKREQKREYLYSNDIAKRWERDFMASEELAKSKLGKFVTEILPWLDIPAGATKAFLTKGLFAGILKKHALEHIERNVKKALAGNYLKDIKAARSFYREIKNAPQSLLDKIRYLREGVPKYTKSIEGRPIRITSQARVFWKPGRTDADLTYWLRNLKSPHAAAHELGHVATVTKPPLGDTFSEAYRVFRPFLARKYGVPSSHYYALYDPAEYAARYFQHHLGPVLAKKEISEAAIKTAVKDIETRVNQYLDVMEHMKMRESPKAFLGKLYRRGIVEKFPPAFARGRTLKDDPEAYKAAMKLLYWY